MRYERLRASTVLCQAAVRGWIVRRRRSRQTQAVITIQQALRRVIQVMLIIIFIIFHLTLHLMAGSKSEEAVRGVKIRCRDPPVQLERKTAEASVRPGQRGRGELSGDGQEVSSCENSQQAEAGETGV